MPLTREPARRATRRACIAALGLLGCGEPQGTQAVGAVTVRAFREGSGVPGAHVVRQRADGTAVARHVTDGDGNAHIEIADGDLVTVGHGTVVYQLVTFVGVTAGAELVVGDPGAHRDPTERLAIAVALPGPHPGSVRYELTAGAECPKATVTDADALASLELYDLCVDASGGVAVLARAIDAGGATVAAATGHGTSTSTLALGPWQPLANATATVTNVPPGAHVEHRARIAVGGVAFDLPGDAAALAPAVARFAERTSSDLTVRLGPAATRRLEDPGPASSAASAYPTDFLPLMAEPILSRDVPARPHISTPGAPIAGIDARFLQIVWPPATTEHVWTVVLPADSPIGFRFPALPDEMADWRPDGAALRAGAAIVESSAIASYHELLGGDWAAIAEMPSDALVRLSQHGELAL